ncbi:MAG: bifunctional diaminohydroxyphosphoribosylaminopyrimidine deaminase/5-amino-6-(5-phosphoribosylamino)uracil reductase RibD [Desulfobacterales bacterium]|nr:bifunctional diaminohydroxyphosphoribosylaminopyrimidine deaminase/5-amino-6-(5-phosphoribosylamino)uracil reductase RibD [Desulfobacterales bacterium]
MKLALSLAEKGRGYTSPNPLVGAVVVKNNKIIGKGYHEIYGKAHAEVNAINNAGIDANDATLYVTLEPCNHAGHTPPCTEKIIESGIRRVVVAMCDPNPNVLGCGMPYLREKGIEITSGVCEDEAKKLNEIFIKYITKKRPFVILKCASTLDGQIATKTYDSKWITNEHSRAFVHKLRHSMSSIMVGVGTILKDNPMLTTRLGDIKGKDPVRIILDTNLSIPLDAKVLHIDSLAETLIITGDEISIEKKERIENSGKTKIITCAAKNGLIDLNSLMDKIASLKIDSVLIEGGATVIASALKSNIVDKICFFYAPKILGGNDGIPICSGKGFDKIEDSIKVKDIKFKRFGDDLMVEGYI